MGRYKSQAMMVRVTKELVIYFCGPQKIVVRERRGGTTIVFHRYGAPLGSYEGSWHPFRTKLQRYQGLTMRRCFELAARHSILYFSTDRSVELNQKILNYRR